MRFGLQKYHEHLGVKFSYESANSIKRGTCDRVEVQPGNFRNRLGMLISNKKIRLRLKPKQGRAFWTCWMPFERREGR